MIRRVNALIHKEFLQILRDPIAFCLLLILPLFILFIFGYAINLDVKNIRLAVYDLDGTQTSRALIDRFVTSGYFTLTTTINSEDEIEKVLDHARVKVVIKIPKNFQRDISKGKRISVQVIIDGTDNNTANIIMGYVKTILQAASMDIIFKLMNNQGLAVGERTPSLDVRPNIRYNPELSSVNFLVPGIIGIIIMVIGAIRMSISLVREKEKGTMEALMVSPLTPAEIMLGKIIPYILIVFVDLILVVVCGKYVFGVPFRGSPVLFLLLSLVFLGAALGTGLLISTISKTCQVAWLLGFLTTILPSIILSGFIFPIESMPVPIQMVTYLLPVRYFLVILRGIILKGVGLSVLYPQALVLLFFAVTLLIVSGLMFKKRL